MSSSLDCAFYTSFYSDVAALTDSIDINEHYLNVGKLQNRVANESELQEVVSMLTHFDDNIYSTANLSFTLVNNLKNQFPDLSTKTQWVKHYYESNLQIVDKYRIINNNDLKYISNLWDNIHNKIFEVVNFNLLFYKTFYTIPNNIHNVRDLQSFWFKNGIFMGQKPNLHSLNEKMNIIGMMQILLIEKFGLDLSFIAGYKSCMIDYMLNNSLPILNIADETSFLLYLFLNTGYKLRLFFNKNDLDKYIANRKKQHDDAIKSIKDGTYKKMIELNNKSYNSESISLMKLVPKKEIIPIELNSFSDIINVKNIIKLSNITVVDCFMKLYNKDNLTDVIITMVINELKNCLEPIVNSMELKILVISVVYNMFMKDKTTSILYKGLVKEKSIEIITAIFQAYEITDSDSIAAIEQDVSFIMENKKIIKLLYLSNIITKIIVELFLLTL